MSINVVKLNGQIEPFSREKLKRSAARVGVPPHLQNELVAYIQTKLYEGIPTSEIFKLIKKFLKNRHRSANIRYNLKKALAELGPSGYPFEKYVAELLSKEGFHTRTNVILSGCCVQHEIDILATKVNLTYLTEVKFHNQKHLRSDVKVPLYIQSRYQDVLEAWQDKTKLLPWIITNTRFTSDARQYAQCSKIKLTSWDFPKDQSLRDKIEATQLYPITILESISQQTKASLIAKGIVTCNQILDSLSSLATTLSPQKLQRVTTEVKLLYGL